MPQWVLCSLANQKLKKTNFYYFYFLIYSKKVTLLANGDGAKYP